MIEYGINLEQFEAKKDKSNGPRPQDGKSGKGKDGSKGTGGAKQPPIFKQG